MPNERWRATSRRPNSARALTQEAGSGPPCDWMLVIHCQAEKAGPVRKARASASPNPCCRSVSTHTDSKPTTNNGRLIPLRARRSVTLSQSFQSHQAPE